MTAPRCSGITGTGARCRGYVSDLPGPAYTCSWCRRRYSEQEYGFLVRLTQAEDDAAQARADQRRESKDAISGKKAKELA